MNTELQDYLNGICCSTSATYNFDVDSSDWAGGGITDQASFDSALGVTTDAFVLSGTNIKANILTTTDNILGFRGQTVTNVNYITVSGLLTLNLDANQIVDFNPTIALPSSLQELYLYNNEIVTFNPTIALPSTLLTLNLAGNHIVTFNPTIALPSTLEFLELYDNQIVDFNPTIALPSSLQELYLGDNHIVTFNPTIALPSTLEFLHLDGNQMTTAGYIASEPWANGMHTATSGGNIDLQFNSDSVSGTNLESILIAKGWAVAV
jgi:Leucine-rich repeat (LRR) protein